MIEFFGKGRCAGRSRRMHFLAGDDVCWIAISFADIARHTSRPRPHRRAEPAEATALGASLDACWGFPHWHFCARRALRGRSLRHRGPPDRAAWRHGRKVHTGRSRNDQVLVATRLWLKDRRTGSALSSSPVSVSIARKASRCRCPATRTCSARWSPPRRCGLPVSPKASSTTPCVRATFDWLMQTRSAPPPATA